MNLQVRGIICFLALLYISCTSLCAQVPTITSFSPSSALIGSQVIIAGSNFSTTPTSNVVYFGGAKGIVTTSSVAQLTVVVPSGATFDYISVTVNGLTVLSQYQFVPIFNNISTLNATSYTVGVDFVSGSPEGIAVADIDGDGKSDVIVTNTLANTLSLLPNKSVQGTLNSSSLGAKLDFYIGLGNAPKTIAIGDLDGDGKLDVVTSNLNKGTLSIFRNTSTVAGTVNSSTFAPVITISIGTAPTDIKIADIDGDCSIECWQQYGIYF
jgi:hypothetical protein